MLENRKPPTNFTIDSILKNDILTSEFSRSPTNHPMNKVLDNPWISKFPLALTFKPSTSRKLNVPPPPITPTLQPNFFDIYNPSATKKISENVLNVTQNFTSVHNHFFYASSTSESNSNSGDFKFLPKLESLSSEKSNYSDVPTDSPISNDAVDLVILSPKSAFKCSVCSKSFENCELLDVG